MKLLFGGQQRQALGIDRSTGSSLTTYNRESHGYEQAQCPQGGSPGRQPAGAAGGVRRHDDQGRLQGGRPRISADYKADKSACASQAGNAKDLCVQEAKAKEKVALAELEYGFIGKAADRNKVLVAKAESAYAVAKERCDDRTGNAKDLCVKEAKAVDQGTGRRQDGQGDRRAKKDAAADKLDADYKVAIEKCDALAGEPKNSCVAAAKGRFGKN